MRSLRGQGGCWGEKLPAGRARQAASAHDLDAQAKRSHLPKGETARSDGHTIRALLINHACKEYEQLLNYAYDAEYKLSSDQEQIKWKVFICDM